MEIVATFAYLSNAILGLRSGLVVTFYKTAAAFHFFPSVLDRLNFRSLLWRMNFCVVAAVAEVLLIESNDSATKC